MLCAVLFMVCSLLAHMLAPESLGCETCSAKLCYNHRLKVRTLHVLSSAATSQLRATWDVVCWALPHT